MTELDKADRRLLSALQANAKTPIAKLAEICCASMSSVQRRLRRLRKDQVILRDTVELDRHQLGFDVKALVFVELERDSATDTGLFTREAIADPCVQQCYCVAGVADFVLIVVAKDMDDYQSFTRRLLVSDRNVKKFRTSMVVSEHKASNALPVLEPER